MQGATAEVSVPLWKDLSAVVEAGGEHTDSVPHLGTSLSLVTVAGGGRFRLANHTSFQPYGQALFGGTHGFDSYFPAPLGSPPTSYDTSFEIVAGGGVDVAISRHFWIRALQVDYFQTGIRNLEGNRQNNLRLTSGVLFRTSGRR
jgi:hypothetical protein